MLARFRTDCVLLFVNKLNLAIGTKVCVGIQSTRHWRVKFEVTPATMNLTVKMFLQGSNLKYQPSARVIKIVPKRMLRFLAAIHIFIANM